MIRRQSNRLLDSSTRYIILSLQIQTKLLMISCQASSEYLKDIPPSVTDSLSKISTTNKIVQFENQRSRCTSETVPTEVKQSSRCQISIGRRQMNYPFRRQLMYLQLSFSSLLFCFTHSWPVMAIKPLDAPHLGQDYCTGLCPKAACGVLPYFPLLLSNINPRSLANFPLNFIV